MSLDGSHHISNLKHVRGPRPESKGTSKVGDIFANVSAEQTEAVMAKMQETQKHVADILREANQPEQQASSIQISLDAIKTAVAKLQEMTGASEGTIIVDVLHAYYAAENLTPADMVNIAASVQFAQIPVDDEGSALLLGSFSSYLDQAESSNPDIETARIQLTSISEGAMCPVGLEKYLNDDGINTSYLTTGGGVFSLQEKPERSVMASETDKMLGFNVIVDTQFASSANGIGFQMEKVNASPVFVQGTVLYEMNNLRANNPHVYAHLQGLLAQVTWNSDGSINLSKTDVHVLNKLHSFLGTTQISKEKN